jgi:hypothetical protein
MTVPSKITFTMTTCKRLEFFKRSMASFMSNCQDLDLISRWIVMDDGSTDKDIEGMKKLYPFLEIHRNSGKGQASALNQLFPLVRTEWFFHTEDDWMYLQSSKFITHLLQMCQEDPRIRNASLRNWYGLKQHGEKFNIKYHMHEYLGKGDGTMNNCQWYGYSLNPGIQHRPTVEMLGKYREDHPKECRRWDRVPAKRYYLLGYKSANVIEKHIEHIGAGHSIYQD